MVQAGYHGYPPARARRPATFALAPRRLMRRLSAPSAGLLPHRVRRQGEACACRPTGCVPSRGLQVAMRRLAGDQVRAPQRTRTAAAPATHGSQIQKQMRREHGETVLPSDARGHGLRPMPVASLPCLALAAASAEPVAFRNPVCSLRLAEIIFASFAPAVRETRRVFHISAVFPHVAGPAWRGGWRRAGGAGSARASAVVGGSPKLTGRRGGRQSPGGPGQTRVARQTTGAP
jgi:hypothetical protein